MKQHDPLLSDMRRTQQEDEIAELLGAVFYAVCSACKKSNKLMAEDLIQAAETYYEEGWRASEEVLICPKCRRGKK